MVQWSAGVIGAAAGAVLAGEPAAYDPGPTYAEVERVVAERFYDEHLHGVDWAGECEKHRGRALAATSPAELGVVVNDLLAELEASHTAFYPVGSRTWAELLDVFLDDEPWDWWPAGFVDLPVTYVGVGIVTREIDGRVFIADVYPGTPAWWESLQVGDEIVSVNGQRWTDTLPWPAPAGEAVTVDIRWERDGDMRTLALRGKALRPDDVFMEAQRQSLRVFERDDVKVGYIRMRNGAGALYADLFDQQIHSQELSDADALVLDIRGGWGGLPLDFVSRFNRKVARFAGKPRDGEWQEQNTVWRKPIVVLTDAGSRSGKEIFAYNVRTAHVGRLVGERTAGAVLGGSPHPMPDGSVLYLAVMDVRVDGQHLEGAGVAPDVEVPFDLPYAAGRDPQLSAAVAEAARMAHDATEPHPAP